VEKTGELACVATPAQQTQVVQRLCGWYSAGVQVYAASKTSKGNTAFSLCGADARFAISQCNGVTVSLGYCWSGEISFVLGNLVLGGVCPV
jgi:hypothetical protein